MVHAVPAPLGSQGVIAAPLLMPSPGAPGRPCVAHQHGAASLQAALAGGFAGGLAALLVLVVTLLRGLGAITLLLGVLVSRIVRRLLGSAATRVSSRP